MRYLLLLFALTGAVPAVAQTATPPPVVATTPHAAPRPAGRARTILFVGNSFTFGAGSAVKRYRTGSVTDLNGDGFGGVPALFKAFTEQVGQDWHVSLETAPGRGLDWHWAERRALIDRAWDTVVLQDYSTLDADRPGDPARHIRYAGLIAAMMARANPRVDVRLVATWTRADQTYRPGGHWYGRPVAAMADDLAAAAAEARRRSRDIRGVVPVGQAWTLAIADGIADANPYDGIDFGRVGLWADDHYHASTAGYYLEALMVFGRVTGLDPTMLGPHERAADDLGLSPTLAQALQRVAAIELARR